MGLMKKYTKKTAKKTTRPRRGARKGKMSKSWKYADVKSFKLTTTESTWVSTVAGSGQPPVVTTGPTVAIGNITPSGNGGSLVRLGRHIVTGKQSPLS